jgi:Tol biopolymer transport system component
VSRSRLGFLIVVPLVVALTLPGAAQATFPGENGKIAFSGCGPEDCGVIAVDADGSERTQITHNPFVDRFCDRFGCWEVPARDITPHWSADGRHLAFSRGGDIYRARADGSGLTRLTATPALEYDPAWSPDGRRIAFTRSPEQNVEQLFVMNSDGTQVTQLAAVGDSPDWSPDGSTIAYVIPNPNPNLPSTTYNHYRDIHRINPDGTGGRPITASQEPELFGYEDPSWSPDGRRIAATGAKLQSRDCCRHDNDVWVMNADGSGRVNLTPNTIGEDNAQPVFSPDGTMIAAQLSTQLIAMNADGTNVSDVSVLGEGGQPDWQPLPGPQRSDYKNSAHFCKAEREFWGDGFAGRYGGGSNAYGKCVSQKG